MCVTRPSRWSRWPATGATATGEREILGLDVVDSEDEVFWKGFMASLKQRGLAGVELVISDQHSGLVAALRRCFQGVRHGSPSRGGAFGAITQVVEAVKTRWVIHEEESSKRSRHRSPRADRGREDQGGRVGAQALPRPGLR